MLNVKYFIGLYLIGFVFSSAQCDFDPVLEGDLIFCPYLTQGTLMVNLENAETYQWYARSYWDDTAEPIDGATSSELNVTIDDLLTFYSVDVTIDGCTERSPEEILDQYAFLEPTVSITGDFVSDSSGFLLCEGDSLYFTLESPYSTNITWYKDGTPIENEHGNTLEVTTPGSYTVSGAPELCPDFILPLGVSLIVLYNTDPEACELAVQNFDDSSEIKIYPNPVKNVLHIQADNKPINAIQIFNSQGQVVYQSNAKQSQRTVDTSNLSAGIYYIEFVINGEVYKEKFIKN